MVGGYIILGHPIKIGKDTKFRRGPGKLDNSTSKAGGLVKTADISSAHENLPHHALLQYMDIAFYVWRS